MNCDVEKFYTENIGLLRFTIRTLQYLPALRKLWVENLEFRPGMEILDVGCGTGALTKTLFEVSRKKKIESIKFFAFDKSQKVLDEFRRWISDRQITNISTLKADARHAALLPYRFTSSFDVVCSSGVLEYLNEEEVIYSLESLRLMMKPNGKIIIMGSRKHLANYFLIQKLYQANLYSKQKFEEMIRKAGFRKINSWKFSFPYSYLNMWGYILVAEK
jgi:ubiquinone/menaquinone biosynthesis C-methylase UbiE